MKMSEFAIFNPVFKKAHKIAESRQKFEVSVWRTVKFSLLNDGNYVKTGETATLIFVLKRSELQKISSNLPQIQNIEVFFR